MPEDDRGLAAALLRRDPLRHIVPLKLLGAHGAAVACRYMAHPQGDAALLTLPAARSAWDAQAYPWAALVALLAAEGRAAADALLGELPPIPLVVKVAGALEREAVLGRGPARRTTAFISYSARGAGRRHPQVQVSASPGPRELAVFAAHGHDPGWLAQLCAAGAGLLLRAGPADAPAICFATRIYERIWEIGGLYTPPELRRRGLARQLVEVALAELGERGLTPRYQVREDNLASIALAESAGLRPFVTVEHYALGAPVASE